MFGPSAPPGAADAPEAPDSPEAAAPPEAVAVTEAVAVPEPVVGGSVGGLSVGPQKRVEPTMVVEAKPVQESKGDEEFVDPMRGGGPRVYYISGSGQKMQVFPTKLSAIVEIHLTTAVVTYEADFAEAVLPKEALEGLIFELPLIDEHASVTGCTALKDDAFYETMVVDKATADTSQKDPKLAGVQEKFEAASPELSLTAYDPTAFRFPLSDLPSKGDLRVCVEEIGDLLFVDGRYELRLPLRAPESAVQISCAINTGLGACQWRCPSHPVRAVYEGDGRAVLLLEKGQSTGENNFVVSYDAWETAIRAEALIEPDADGRGGHYSVFVAPPSATATEGTVPRRVVLLLDVSGSMGNVIAQAKQAMVQAVQGMQAADAFALCAFNHEQHWFCREGNQLEWFRAGDLEDAISWVNKLRPGGLTDIFTPVQTSLENLTGPLAPPSEGELPVLLLITDGAVANEKDICNFVKNYNDESQAGERRAVRFFTFGIGPFCNRYFLQRLGTLGRGYTDVVLSEGLREKMSRLLLMSSSPVLTDLTLSGHGVDLNSELYPSPIPDLYVGAPLVLSGRYEGAFPSQVELRGRDSSRQTVTILAAAFHKESVPVRKLFAKKKLDHLIALQWITDGKEGKILHDEVVELSVAESIPTPFTAPVIYHAGPPPPPKPEPPPTGKVEAGDGKVTRPDSFGPPPIQPAHKRKDDEEADGGSGSKKKKKKKKKKGGIGAGTGVFLLGTAAVGAIAFGSIAATTAGVDVAGAIGGVFSGIGDIHFDGFPTPDLPNIDVNCPDCGCANCLDNFCCFDVGGACENGYDCVANACPCFEPAAAAVGGALGSALDCITSTGIGECCCFIPNLVGDICSPVVGAAGDVCSPCLGALGSGADVVSGLCNPVCGLLGDGCLAFGGAVGTVTGAAGDVCGNVCGFLPDLCGNLGGVAGDCVGLVGGTCGAVGSVAGDCVGAVGGCCEAVPDLLGNIGDLVAPLGECLCDCVKAVPRVVDEIQKIL